MVLPAPDGPTSASRSPGATDRLKSCSAERSGRDVDKLAGVAVHPVPLTDGFVVLADARLQTHLFVAPFFLSSEQV